MSISNLVQRVPARQRPAVFLAAAYVLLCLVLRAGLLLLGTPGGAQGWHAVTVFAVGAAYDLCMAAVFALPVSWAGALWPSRLWSGWRLLPLLATWYGGLWLMAFVKVAEAIFWDEFGVRFNFIAVDYLVYTTEVVANIHESYPVFAIAGAVTGLVAGAGLVVRRSSVLPPLPEENGRPGRRLRRWGLPVGLTAGLAMALAALGLRGWFDAREEGVEGSPAEHLVAGLRHLCNLQPEWSDATASELAKNGEFAFFAAFWSNRLPWDRFYPSSEQPVAELRGEMAADGVRLGPSGVLRAVPASSNPRKLNVVMITVESLSAKYVGAFGVNDSEDGVDYGRLGLTPNLDRLAGESLWFEACYAGGTRTVRGMEALTLSVPPIPGQSILRRRGCERLGTLGSALAQNGYDTAFIYGGDGFFDNMSYFFGTNGYRVVDLPAKLAQGVQPAFANAWGASDEDSLRWSLEEADRAHAAGRPFHHFVMTTSNHRPFTWPEGRISPELKGRRGGVAYTDHAIGAFLEAAKGRPWFKDTLFVIVADHGSSVAGKRELEVSKYHIPFLIWSPGNVAPRRVPHLVSQIDVAPTVLGLLGLPHVTTFVGADALGPSYRPRAFVSNYQRVGMIRDGVLTVLKPVRRTVQFRVDLASGSLEPLAEPRPELAAAARAYYQGTDTLHADGGLKSDQSQ